MVEPTRRFPSPRPLAYVAVVLLALSMVGCRNRERDEGPASAEQVHDAVTAAATKLRTSDITFTVDVTVTGWNSWRTHGTGRIAHAPRPSMAVDFPGMPIVGHWLYGGGNVRMIMIDRDLYVHVGTLSPREQQFAIEDGGAKWLRMDLNNPEAATLALDTVVDYATQYTPVWQMEMLLASTDLSRIASETIGGIETTRYEGTVKLSDAAALPEFERVASHSLQTVFREVWADQAHYVVWLDAERRVRRIAVGMRSDHGVLEMNMEVAQSGASTPISAPPKASVRDLPMP